MGIQVRFISDLHFQHKNMSTHRGFQDYKGFALTHCPIHPIELERYRGNIHGHTHENVYEDKRYINVCAEVIDCKPKTLEELIIRNEL